MFDEKDLIEFGKYLLSEQRKKTVPKMKGLPAKDAQAQVYQSDLANWKEKRK